MKTVIPATPGTVAYVRPRGVLHNFEHVVVGGADE